MGRENALGDQPGDPGGGEQPADEIRIPPKSGRVPPGGRDERQVRGRLGFLTRLALLAPGRSGADPARGSALCTRKTPSWMWRASRSSGLSWAPASTGTPLTPPVPFERWDFTCLQGVADTRRCSLATGAVWSRSRTPVVTTTNKGTSTLLAESRWLRMRPRSVGQETASPNGPEAARRSRQRGQCPHSPCQQVATRSSDVRH